MSSIIKFVGEQSDKHGGKLHWPGALGVPTRGPIPVGLPQDSFDEHFELVGDFHHREFDLSVESEDKEYNDVMDRIASRWYVLYFIDRVRDPETGKRKVYLEWIHRYSMMNRPPDVFGSVATRVG